MLKMNPSGLVILAVLFLSVFEERSSPQTSSGGHPACRNLPKQKEETFHPYSTLEYKAKTTSYLHKDGRWNYSNELVLEGAEAEGNNKGMYPGYYQHSCSWHGGTKAVERALGKLKRYGCLQTHISPSRNLSVNRCNPSSDLKIWN